VIRVLIADDHPIVRDGLNKLLSLEEDVQVVGEASDGCEVLDKVQELDPDVLLLDLRMPNLDGLSALQALQQTNKRTRVIVLTASEDKNEFVQAMKLGCSGIVLKQTAPELIAKSIRKVHSGEIYPIFENGCRETPLWRKASLCPPWMRGDTAFGWRCSILAPTNRQSNLGSRDEPRMVGTTWVRLLFSPDESILQSGAHPNPPFQWRGSPHSPVPKLCPNSIYSKY
jgi:CheY-like chemotaxis protein